MIQFLEKQLLFIVLIAASLTLARLAHQDMERQPYAPSQYLPHAANTPDAVSAIDVMLEVGTLKDTVYKGGDLAQVKISDRYWQSLSMEQRYDLLECLRLYSRAKTDLLRRPEIHTARFQIINSKGERVADCFLDKFELYQ